MKVNYTELEKKVRHSFVVENKSIQELSRELGVNENRVKHVLNSYNRKSARQNRIEGGAVHENT